MSIKIDKNAGNTADSFRILSISSSNGQGGSVTELMGSQALSIGNGGETTMNGYLEEAGVARLNELISKQIVGRDPRFSVSGAANGTIFLQLKGSNVPTGSRVACTLTVTLDVAIDYSYCQEISAALFSVSEDPGCQ